MQVFKSIPFHVFQDHCSERRFKYLGVPNYYDVVCSLAGVEQCNPRICPVWNAPAVLPVAPVPPPVQQQSRPPQGQRPAPYPHQPPPPRHPAPLSRAPGSSSGVDQPVVEIRPPAPAPITPASIAHPPAAQSPAAVTQSIDTTAPAFSSADPDDSPEDADLDIEIGSGETGGSLREINLKLKEEALLAPKPAARRRPSRRRGGNR